MLGSLVFCIIYKHLQRVTYQQMECHFAKSKTEVMYLQIYKRVMKYIYI